MNPSSSSRAATEGQESVNSSYSSPRRVGPFLLGPKFDSPPAKCVTHFLARREGTQDFFTVKVLTIAEPAVVESTDDMYGKILLRTEYNLLRRLEGLNGVPQEYGMIQDHAEDDGRMVDIICLVLGCYMPHNYSRKCASLLYLQQFVIQEKKLEESMAIKILCNVVKVVEALHQRHIVHRDIKLGNIVVDKNTLEVTIINFGLAKYVTAQDELLLDQCGSPAYVSPEGISKKPYAGKPSDMWSLGVALYTMLYGKFPFFDVSPRELFKKVQGGVFDIPTVGFTVSVATIKLLKSLLVVDPQARPTASDIWTLLNNKISAEEALLEGPQIVPTMDDDDYQPRIRQSVSFPVMSDAEVETALEILQWLQSDSQPPPQPSGPHVNTTVIPSGNVPSVNVATNQERGTPTTTQTTPPSIARRAARAVLVATRRRIRNLHVAVRNVRLWRIMTPFPFSRNKEDGASTSGSSANTQI
ncbi:Serine/threonine-protein kinase 40 [Folsomia candida]|uniref:Serine/threonine-protein kinase 40 n=1 Tax=Folsomia candida TaxID=158441 RepID=A0A226DJF3_FOLCA|nr:Serine/threonine-protein kinase 40 [Folsomia candida]